MESFFNSRSKKKIIIRVTPPDVETSILKRLGKPKFWVSNNDFYETMGKIYKRASKAALENYFRQKPNIERANKKDEGLIAN